MDDDRGRDHSSDNRSTIDHSSDNRSTIDHSSDDRSTIADHSSDDRSTIDDSSDDRSTIDHDLRRALAVEPSPAFKARVRERIVREAAPSAWGLRWIVGPAALAAVALVVLLAVVRWIPAVGPGPAGDRPLTARSVPTDVAATLPRLAPRPGGAIVGEGAAPLTLARTRPARPTPPAEPLALFSAAESAALQRLIADAAGGRLDLRSLTDPRPAEALIEPPMEILVQPIAITLIQIRTEADVQGDPQ